MAWWDGPLTTTENSVLFAVVLLILQGLWMIWSVKRRYGSIDNFGVFMQLSKEEKMQVREMDQTSRHEYLGAKLAEIQGSSID